jgi:polysaccharide deacetylase family protein (PEP-CTERM system associated)
MNARAQGVPTAHVVRDGGTIVNALTIDVEDYFQVSAFESHVPRSQWESMPCRVERNVERILELLHAGHARATFFTLAWIARRFPAMVRRIVDAGHEIASHGSAHARASDQTPEEFHDDIAEAKRVLEDLGGTHVRGYRAPSFSIGPGNAWAHECIARAGYAYSSSVYPIRHDHYGAPTWPRFPYEVVPGLVEVPVATVRLLNRNLPAGGGGYFRLLPYGWTRWGISRLNTVERRPAIFYLHPWEVDPDQPRLPAGLLGRIRHYRNLRETESRLRQMLGEFRFGRLRDLLVGQVGPLAPCAAAQSLPYLW